MIFLIDLARSFVRARELRHAAGNTFIAEVLRAVLLHEVLATPAKVVERESCGSRLSVAPPILLSPTKQDSCPLSRMPSRPCWRRMDFL